MTASAVVLEALNQAYGSASSKAFLAAVAEGEGGTTFNILYGGSMYTGSLAAFPEWAGVSVGNSETHAAGAFQFEPASYEDAAKISGRSGFYPQDQIQNAWDYAATVFVAKSGMNLHDVLAAAQTAIIPAYLMSIWPGGCDHNFPERFAANLPLVMTTTPPSGIAITQAALNPIGHGSQIAKVRVGPGRGRKFAVIRAA